MKKKSMSNNKTFSFFLALCLLFSFSIISCNNVLEDDIQNDAAAKTERSDNTETPDATKGYLKIKFLDTVRKSARTVSPTIDLTQLTDIRLQGSLNGNPAYDENWASVSAIEASPLAFERGSWSFTLSATYDGYSFSDTKPATIVLGQTTSISFELASATTNGGLELKVNFNGDADKAEWVLMSYPGTSVIDNGESTYNAGDEKKVEYIRNTVNPIAAGTYRFKIEFFENCIENGAQTSKLKNTYSEIINIRPGFTSKAERTITLNDLHTISYEMNGGTPDSTSGTALPEIYSAQDTAVTLADLEKEGYEFKGWYTGENGAGNKITKVPDNALANADVVLHAHFTIINYPITYYDMDGATYLSGQSNPETYTVLDDITFANPVKSHYTFTGWYRGQNGGGNHEFGITAGTTGPQIFWANWRPDPKVIVTPGFPGDYKVGWKLIKNSTGRNIEIIIKDNNGAVTTNTFNVKLYIGGTFIKDYPDKTFTYPNFLPDPTDSSFLVEFSVAPTDSTTYTYEYYPQRLYLGSKAPSAAKEVGDVVFNDGSAEPYVDGMTFTNEQINNAVALIFYKGTECNNAGNTSPRTLGVGLVHASRKWCIEGAKANSVKIPAIECQYSGAANSRTFTGDLNGSDNLIAIAAQLGLDDDTETAANYPAFYFAKQYKNNTGSHVTGSIYENGWYLPSFAELYQISLVTSVFDIFTVSQALGGGKFNTTGRSYLSSSNNPNNVKSTYKFNFNTNQTQLVVKTETYYVCAIREF